MDNKKASAILDFIHQNDTKVLPSDKYIMGIIEKRVFQNKALSASQAEFLLDLWREVKK